MSFPALTGSNVNAPLLANLAPQRRIGDLVTPLDDKGFLSKSGHYIRPGASTIYREQGQRLIAVKFGVRDRDLASTVAEAKSLIDPLLQLPYRAEWSGEFQEMEEAEGRLLKVFSLSLVLILVFLYLAFRSILDAGVVFANVLAMAVGGIWALKIVGLNFNISAAVGFISILGVAVMNGLLFVSAFNRCRAGPAARGGFAARDDPAGSARHYDRVSRDSRSSARRRVDPHWLPIATAAGHRRGRGHAGDSLTHEFGAGVLQLLWQAHTSSGRRRYGPLRLADLCRLVVQKDFLLRPSPTLWTTTLVEVQSPIHAPRTCAAVADHSC